MEKMIILENGNNYTILREENNYILISYKSHVATYNSGAKKLKLFNNWDYSRTTLKQVKDFVNYYTNKEYKTKQQFEKLIKTSEEIEEGE